MPLLKVNPGIVLIEEENGESLLFDPEAGTIKILNPAAAFIYKHLDGKTTGREIADRMIHVFEGQDATEIESDVEEFIGECLRLGLLREAVNICP